MDTAYVIYDMINGHGCFWGATSCYVTKIQKDNEEQYIYLCTWNNDPKSECIDFCSGGVNYEFTEFQNGTYLINIFDTNSYVYKKRKNGKDISEYFNGCTVTNKGIAINKISNDAISLEKVEYYYRNKELTKPEAVKKILSVFNPEFEIE